jgi:tripartite-type tricarboxylate transporter receptor subunit TctC
MAGELLKNLTGIDIVHVPYKGSTGARNDILSGQVQILFDSVPTMAPMIKAGLVRALATTGKTRSSTLPDVPTIEEAGVPGFNATLWVGFMAPAATPQRSWTNSIRRSPRSCTSGYRERGRKRAQPRS